MLLLLPATATAASPPTWERTDLSTSVMVRLESPGRAVGEHIPAMVRFSTELPEGLVAALGELNAWDASGTQLPCDAEGGTSNTVVWVDVPVPQGSDWIWLDWSGQYPVMHGVFGEFQSVHHFSHSNPEENAVSAAHTATLSATLSPVSGRVGDWVVLDSGDTVSIPYTDLPVGSGGWTISVYMTFNNPLKFQPILTAGSVWFLRTEELAKLSLHDYPGPAPFLDLFADQPRTSDGKVLAIRYATGSPTTVSTWVQHDPDPLTASVAKTLSNQLNGALVFSGPTSGTVTIDEVRVFDGVRSEDWLYADAWSMSSSFATPCVGSDDDDDDGICDDLDLCPNEANVALDGSDCSTEPIDTSDPNPPTDKTTTDGPGDTGPTLVIPALRGDPGCACDTAPVGWAPALGLLFALGAARRRRQP